MRQDRFPAIFHRIPLSLQLGISLLVLLAALLHASWNALLKSDSDRVAGMAAILATGGVVGLALTPWVPFPERSAWPYLLASAVVHHIYYFTLIKAYRHGDLSHVYPIARGLGPFIVAILSGPVLGEALGVGQMAGVVLVSLGLASLTLHGRSAPARPGDRRANMYAVLTGLLIAAYTVLDAKGVRAVADPFSYIVWLNVFEAPFVPLFAFWLRGRAMFPYLHKHGARAIVGGLLATLGYGIIVWAFAVGTVAEAATLRETSVIFAALIGTLFLGEPFGRFRVLAAALVAAGVILLHVAR
jgi:drug/metabolite transporter (DMT)-like permease